MGRGRERKRIGMKQGRKGRGEVVVRDYIEAVQE